MTSDLIDTDASRLFQQLIDGVVNLYDDAFFQGLVNGLAKVMGADLAMISMLDHENPHNATSLALCLDGVPAANIYYRLENTPCQDLTGRKILYLPDGAMMRYPQADMLNKLDLDGYLGIPLCDHDEQPLGNLLIASRNRLRVPAGLMRLLPVLINRVEAELTRQSLSKRLSDSNDQLQRIQSLASLGGWTLDVKTRQLNCSPQARSLFGLHAQNTAVLSDVLEQLFTEDRAQLQQLTEQVLTSRQMDTCLVRLKHPTGSARWLHIQAEPVSDPFREVTLIRGVVQDMTELINSQNQVIDNEMRFRALVDASPYGIIEIDLQGRVIFANPKAHQIFAYPPDQMVGRTISETMLEDEQEYYSRKLCRMVDEFPHLDTYSRKGIRQDGSIIDIQVNINYRLNEQGKTRGFVGFISDITSRNRRELKLRQLSTVVEQSPSAILITNQQGVIEYVNPAFEASTGYLSKAAIGETPRILKSGKMPEHIYEGLWENLHQGLPWRGELLNHRANKEEFWALTSIAPITGDDEHITHYVCIMEDITRHKQQEQQLAFQAKYDAVTGLPNRMVAMQRLTDSIRLAKKRGRHVLVIFIDLDHFKRINDSFGHSIGDRFLGSVAELLKEAVRNEDIIARFGGDEFLLVMDDIDEITVAERIIEKVLRAFNAPVYIEEHELFVTASLGGAVYPQDGDNAETLLRNADAAMYIAKSRGRNDYHFFTPEMNQHAQQQMIMETHLQRALEFEEMSLHFQPITCSKRGEVVACEVLLRWHSPVLSNVSPEEFIPLAEDLGLINELGEWVIERALEQYLRWRTALPDDFRMCINVSPKQFQKSGFADWLLALLEQYQLSPQMLELEITEGLLLNRWSEVDEQIQKITGAGIRLSINDFGTGFASISYLRRYSFNTLKIDKSFVAASLTDSADAALIRSVIALAKGMGLTTVAEGVETPEQAELLQNLGCDRMQGFLYSKPVSQDHFMHLIQTPEGVLPA